MKNIKKQGGNTVLIVMVLGALAALALGFLVIRKAIKTNPTPTPAPTAEVTPTPEPTPETPIAEDLTAVNAATAGWKTYTNTKYNYSVKYPTNLKVGSISGNSVLGTYSAPVKGYHVGPLVFVSLSGGLRKDGADYFNESYNLALHPVAATPGEPSLACQIDKVSNPNAAIKSVTCNGEGGLARYALISGKDFDVFVDGYSKGYDSSDNGTLAKDSDYINILSTFSFSPSTTQTPTPTPVANQTPTPGPNPTPPVQKIENFMITADDSSANPASITMTKGDIAEVTFIVSSSNVYYGGLDFRSSVVNSGTIYSGQSKTISFTADKSFSFTPYWPSSNTAKNYKINVMVQ